MVKDANMAAENDDPFGTGITCEVAQDIINTCIERGILVDYLKSKGLDEMVELLRGQAIGNALQEALCARQADEKCEDVAAIQ